jgi:hypothetical protein
MVWDNVNGHDGALYGRLNINHAAAMNFSSARTLRSMARRLTWDSPHRGVITLPGAPDTAEGRIAAALASVGPPALASHWTAAWLYGLVRTLPTTVHLLLPHDRRATTREKVQIHRTRVLHDSHAAEVSDLATTSGARTLGDLSGELNVGCLRAWCIDLCQRGDASWDELDAVADVLGPVKGVKKFRSVIADGRSENPESILDYRLRKKLRGALGLRPDRGSAQVAFQGRTLRIDIPWARYMVGIEADSLTYHGDRASLQRDISRHNLSRPSEWIVFRAGWAEVDDPAAWAELLEVVTAALKRRGAPL